MTATLTWLFNFCLILVILLLILFIVYSILEKEKRAIKRGLMVFIFFALLAISLNVFWIEELPFLFVIPVIVLVLLVLKFNNHSIEFQIPAFRFDERDVMFSRNTLIEGSEKFEAYYKQKPENKIPDDKFRKEPGLMAPGSTFYNEILFGAAHASFATVDLLQPLVEQKTTRKRTNLPQGEITRFLQDWVLKLGAVDVGFTKLKEHHIYSHIGRGEAYGEEVDLSHKFAIAFTVEMNHEALSHNPRGQVVMESAQQYLNAGQIAVQVAEFLRTLGYEARAHIDANYRLICPTVAVDAGLGTIGRMGLLMTPKLGPRVRIGVVSTDLELPVKENHSDYSAIHFCELCKKCAENCPSQAIPKHSVSKTKPAQKWTINHEKCFTYWCKTGTDCGRCMAVCPYSHPDNFMHNLIRWMIKRNPVNRWFALKLDDFFYGRKP